MTHDPRNKIDNDVRGAERLARTVAAYYHELHRTGIRGEDLIYLVSDFQNTLIQANNQDRG